jgi:hypothetical protein
MELIEEKSTFIILVQNGFLENLVGMLTDPFNDNAPFIFRIFTVFIRSFEGFTGQLE